MIRGITAFFPRTRPALILAGLLVGWGCATGSPGATAAALPAPISDQVLAVGLARVVETYLNPVDVARLMVDGLGGLRTIDPQITVERDDGTVRLMRNGRKLSSFALPEQDDPATWASIATRLIDRARLASPALHEAGPDQIHQAVFDAMMPDLDPYSRYTGPQRANSERAAREGYGGIGLTINPLGDRFVVASLVAEGPALRAGIRVGDLIEAINGIATSGQSFEDVRDSVRGTPGTTVQLTLVSAGVGRKVSIQRERVIPNAVQLRLNKGVAVLKLERFNAATTANLREAVASALARLGPRTQGFILDLRGNPGGLLDQAVAVADLFIRRGRIISTAGRHPDSWQRFDATADDILSDRPLVVLIDGRSASAAEIVAAALQDSGRAVVVGASSFGKGSVQTVTRLPNDGELFLTWSRIYAPSGYTLHRQGIQPTICTSHDGADAEALLAPLQNGNLEPPVALARWRAAAPDDEAALAHLRQVCPWKAHEPELDLQVAERLLARPALYRSALAHSTTAVAER